MAWSIESGKRFIGQGKGIVASHEQLETLSGEQDSARPAWIPQAPWVSAVSRKRPGQANRLACYGFSA